MKNVDLKEEGKKHELEESDFPLTEDDEDNSIGGGSSNATSPTISLSGKSNKLPFKLKPITFDDDSALEEVQKSEGKNEVKADEENGNDIEFDFSNSENDTFKSMALTDLIKLDQISRKVYTVSSKDGFIPGQFWNGICAKHGKCMFIDAPSLLRMQIVRGSKLGEEVIKHVTMGRNVPSTILSDIVTNALKEDKNARGIAVIYGYPNTLQEHMAFSRNLDEIAFAGSIFIDQAGTKNNTNIVSQNVQKSGIGIMKSLQDQYEQDGLLHTFALDQGDASSADLKRLKHFVFDCLSGNNVVDTPVPSTSHSVNTSVPTTPINVVNTPETSVYSSGHTSQAYMTPKQGSSIMSNNYSPASVGSYALPSNQTMHMGQIQQHLPQQHLAQQAQQGYQPQPQGHSQQRQYYNTQYNGYNQNKTGSGSTNVAFSHGNGPSKFLLSNFS